MLVTIAKNANQSFNLVRKLKAKPIQLVGTRYASGSTATADLFYRESSSDGTQITLYSSLASESWWSIICYGYIA